MHNVKNYILLLLILGLAFFSCNKQDLEAEVPSYVYINNFSFSSDYATQGTSSNLIPDAWVYINQELIGVFELPVKIPIIKEGVFQIEVYPGIKENGISERRKRYLYYAPHVEQILLQKNKVIEISPSSTYLSSTKFSWLEDFEQASIPFTYNVISDTTMHKTTSAYEGIYSGRVQMVPTMDFFECISPPLTNLPSFGSTIFMELDFKTNQPVLVGLYADTEQVGLFYLNTTASWKKIYLNFSEAFQSNPGASQYRIFFGFQNNVSYPEFFIDNIKIVHF